MLISDVDTVRSWQGRAMVDRDGDRIGSIEDIYADDQSGEPEWALVKTGLFGTKSSFVPIVQASQRDGDVQVPYDKQLVKDAPRIEADQHLSEADEQQLWRHYGLDYGAGQAGTAPQPQPGIDEAMTRSEEELRVGTETRERGRVRLRKYVTTEEVTLTVPVRREEVRLEREPVTDANLDAATSGPELTDVRDDRRP
jgi:sporulation protein YlmC with PRC-barrel domain